MVSIFKQYQSEVGSFKFSRARRNSSFQGRTSGLALKYVIQGKETYSIDDKNFSIPAGSFVIFNPSKTYQTHFNGNFKEVLGLCIDLEKDVIINEEQRGLIVNTVYESELNPMSLCMQNIASNNYTNENFQLENLVKGIQQFSNENLDFNKRLEIYSKKLITRKEIVSRMRSTRKFIQLNFKKKINLDQLASRSNLSKYHFLRLFRLCFQQSPKEMIIDLKMKEAQKMLKDKKRCSDIAFYLGYADQAAFSNQFKKLFKYSPSEFVR